MKFAWAQPKGVVEFGSPVLTDTVSGNVWASVAASSIQ